MEVKNSQEQEIQLFLKEIAEKVSKKSSEGLEKWQLAAWNKVLLNGLPTKNVEAFRYVRFQELYGRSYEQQEIADDNSLEEDCHRESRYKIVLKNGVYNSTLSALPKGCLLVPLSKAFSTFGPLLNSHFSQWIDQEKNSFVHLNLASTEGLFLYIPPKLHIEHPIHIIHLNKTGNKAVYAPSRFHLFLGKASSLELIETWHGAESPSFTNVVIDAVLEDAALLKIRMLSAENAPKLWAHFALRAQLKRDSKLQMASLYQGGLLRREDYHVILKGENAEADLKGGWFLNRSEESHTAVLIEHQEPHCRSLQTFKGVLNDRSRSSFEGKIYVHDKAQKTQAYQMNKNLLLSNHAQAFSKPNLEIFADDVKASHGATVGQLNDEELFYLKSRGIPLERATTLLIRGFVQEILEPFSQLSQLIKGKIKGD